MFYCNVLLQCSIKIFCYNVLLQSSVTIFCWNLLLQSSVTIFYYNLLLQVVHDIELCLQLGCNEDQADALCLLLLQAAQVQLLFY